MSIRLVGVIHLPALPGSPRHRQATNGIDAIVEGVRHDVIAMRRARYDAVIVENFGDAPFEPGAVSPITVATMTTCARAAVEAAGSMPIGINVLRNDALSALAIAAASGARFIRVNVHVGAVVADQGIIQGRAHETLRARRAWNAEGIDVWADVDVKHAAPLARRGLAEVTHDTVLRGLASAVMVTGAATGARVDGKVLREVADALHGTRCPLYVASGAVPDDLPRLAEHGATGVVVGSWLRRGGKAGGLVDAARAAKFATAFRKAFRG